LVEWVALAWFGLLFAGAVAVVAYMFLWAAPMDALDEIRRRRADGRRSGRDPERRTVRG
jgi:hypothetical protein